MEPSGCLPEAPDPRGLEVAGCGHDRAGQRLPTPLRDEELELVCILVNGVNAGERLPRPVEHIEVGQQ